MTYTPSNRPVGSDAPQDQYFNAGKLDEYVNSQESTMVDRNGIERLTIKGIEQTSSDASGSAAAAAIAAAASAESAAAAASLAFANSGGPFATVAEGMAATAVGRYFTIVSPSSPQYLDLYRNVSGSAVYQKSSPSSAADSLTVNIGKSFPFKQMNRAGVTSPASTTFNNLVLDVKVIGEESAISGKYFRIAYFQNDANVSGNADQGIVIEQFDAATYSTVATPTVINNHNDAPADIVRTGGVQAFVIVPPGAPMLRFIIVIDASALPPAGTQISAQTNGTAHYSWIIDPACYIRIAGIGDTNMLNRARAFPLRQMSKGGLISPANAVMNLFLLNVEVLNAEPGKYYRILFQKNGAALTGSYEFGWILEEADAAGYVSSGTSTQIHTYTNPAPDIDRAGGVQTIVVTPAQRTDLRFKITVDASALPASGTPIDANSTGAAGRSWIVDPSRYTAPPVIKDDSLSINKGKAFPLRQMTRGGVTSPANTAMNSLLLNVEVSGATAGMYYLISYQQNQQSIGGDTDFGWILYEADAATFATVGTVVQIHTHTDPAPDIDRNGGIQSITITPVSRKSMRFRITLDASALPAAGTPIDANSTGAAGRSWIVDPSNYFLAESQASTAKQLQAGRMWVEGETTGNIFSFTWSHGASQMYRVTWGPNQINQLFNFISQEIAPLTNISTAAWTLLQGGGTDWLPPLTVEAINNGDGADTEYTGGGHASVGANPGLPTARMINFKASVNGQEMGAAQTFSGPADTATFTWEVEIYAYNTVTLNRYVVRQYFTLHVRAGSVEAICEPVALEDIRIKIDNGPQMGVYGAYPDWVHYIGDNRGPLLASDPAAVSAQSKTVAPDVFALVCSHPTNGFCASWLDRNYEAGDGRYLLPTAPFARKNTASWKFYQAVVNGNYAVLAPGQSYRWRGGYAWAPKDLVAGDVNCAFQYTKGGKPWVAWAINAAGSGTVKPVPSVAGRTVGGSVVGPRGLDVTAPGYAIGNSEIG